MADAARSRRSILQSLILLLLGGTGLWRFLTPRRGTGRGTTVVVVPEADVPHEGVLVLPAERLAIVNRGGELRALDLTCTHLGCTVKATVEGFACPCHGSRFDPSGMVLRGPASRPLLRLSAVVREGMIQVARDAGSAQPTVGG